MTAIATRPRPAPSPPDTGVRPRRWTRQEFHRATELGLFGPEERLELLDGEVLAKMTQNAPHALAILSAVEVLAAAFGAGNHVRPQMPLILDDESEPQPDVLVVAGTRFDYLASHPKPENVRLLVEVSDTTLRFDRGRKQRAYARAGVPEYWVLNLLHRQLEVYRNPAGSRYRSVTGYSEQETVTPLAAPHATLRVADLLPPPTGAG